MSKCVKNSSELRELPAYRLEYEGPAPDCHGAGIVLRHIKSGARVCVISNEDDNKVFGIGFRTTPFDSTGVPHIIEHSVLCGSEKFPVKDPFVELMKGSLNTFLNAMTMPDKTCYPVASCNDADFANLMDVYMDAVFHPNIYKEEKIFKQEGWHYELTSPDEPITINGVVYNEMKGAYGSADSRLQEGIGQAISPENTYGHDSGGNPKDIPSLTYENFLEFHSRYYHPTNSYIFLYGNMDIEERLEWLDQAYLSGYEVQEVDSEVKRQKPLGTRQIHDYYPAAEEDPIEGASYLAWAFSVAETEDLVTNHALNAIFDALFNTTGAPVKEALIRGGVGQDVSCDVDDSRLQPYAEIVVRNTDPDKMEDFKRILKEELEKAVKEGINKDSLLASINRSEFNFCEADFGRTPKGLVYAINILNTWSFDDSKALCQLNHKPVYEELRSKLETGYFEELVDRYLLKSQHEIYYTLEPKKGISEEEDAKLVEKLAAYKASLSADEIDRLIKETAELKAYQAEPSTPEQLLTVPQLTREEIGEKASPIVTEKKELGGIPVLYHNVETNGIVYLKLLFDLDRIPKDQLELIGLSTKLFGNMNTAKRSYLEMENQVNIHTGGIFTDVSTFQLRGHKDTYRPMYVVSGRAMSHETDTLLELMAEELLETDFTDMGRVKELVAEAKSRLQGFLMNSGVRVAMGRAIASLSSAKMYSEYIDGLYYYSFINKLMEGSDEEYKQAIEGVKTVCAAFIGSDNLTLDITCSKEEYDKLEAKLAAFTSKLSPVRGGDTCGERLGMTFDHENMNEGFKLSGEVNYVALAGNFDQLSTHDAGIMNLVSSMMHSDYLWNNIRVLGGAYGCGFNVSALSSTGNFYSFRDPKLAETLEVFRAAAQYLRDFEADEREMTKFVIGTIGSIDKPLTPAGIGDLSMVCALNGTEPSYLDETRSAVLGASVEDIHQAAKILDQILATNSICVVGSEKSINANAGLFKEVKNLL